MINMKEELNTLFKNCLNILRDNEHLTGTDALNTLSQFLTFKLIQDKLSNEINFANLENHYEEIDDNQFEFLIKCCNIDFLLSQNRTEIKHIIKDIWTFILSKHDKLKVIFNEEDNFILKNNSSYKTILTKLNNFDFSHLDHDIQGEVYEEVIKDIMIGKVLGQFFTPPELKQYIVKELNPKIGNTIFDPAMGTGGFLITTIRHFIRKAKEDNIKLDWVKLSNQISGREAHEKTHQMAMANMLISTGHIFNLEHDDSIRKPITNKYDIVMANPPFGIKGLNYDEIVYPLKDEYLPIKTKNSIQLFLQAIVYMLNLNGKCGIVLPNGRELYGTDTVSVNIRKFLMKTCKLTKITYMPANIFNNTSIKTCVLFFEKRKVGNDIIKVKQNGKKISYEFCNEDITQNVQFIDYTEDKQEKILINVPIEKIKDNNYSLNYSEYLMNIIQENTNEIQWKTIGEIFDCKMGKFNSNDMDNKGNIPFYSCKSNNPVGFHSIYSFDYQEYLLLICAGGSQKNIIGKNVGLGKCYYVQGKTACRANVCSLILKSNTYNLKYISYYLNFNRIETNKKAKFTTNLGTISISDVKSLKIPVPSLEIQQKIVEQINFIHTTNENSKKQVENLKQLNEMFLKTQLQINDCHEKSLGEICEIEYGTRIVKKRNKEGIYPVYGSGRAMFTTETFNRDGFQIVIGRFALSNNCIQLLNKRFFLNDSGLTITSNLVNNKYLGFYLLNNKNLIYKCSRGTAQKNLDMNYFKNIKITLPSLEIQQKIVEYCDFNNNLIQQLEKQITLNDELIKNILTF